jgi:hypothetical protein
MAKAYALLIMRGQKTIDQVPARIKEAVQAILDAAGYEPPAGVQEEDGEDDAAGD